MTNLSKVLGYGVGGGGSTPTTLEVLDENSATMSSGVLTTLWDETGVWRIDLLQGPSAAHDMGIYIDGTFIFGEDPPAASYGTSADHEWIGPLGDIIVPMFCSTGFQIKCIGSGGQAVIKAVKIGT